jgi:hypothetical protein
MKNISIVFFLLLHLFFMQDANDQLWFIGLPLYTIGFKYFMGDTIYRFKMSADKKQVEVAKKTKALFIYCCSVRIHDCYAFVN